MNSVARFSPIFNRFLLNKFARRPFGIVANSRNFTLLCSRNSGDIRIASLQNIFLSRRYMTNTADGKIKFDVTAYATSEEYKLESMKKFLKSKSTFKVKELPEDALDVICVEMNPDPISLSKGFFSFREGSVVFWNCSEKEESETLEALSQFQITSYDQSLVDEQTETFQCIISQHKSGLVDGDIYLQKQDGDHFDYLELLAFSNAISHSVKLAIWESFMDKEVTSNKPILEDLQKGHKLKATIEDVLKICGKLYKLRHHINLGSSLLDTPDFYWDRSNLEKLYHKTRIFLNIPNRTRVINEKLHHSVEFMELIRDHLKDKHHTRLELMIIFLITIEVFFGTYHFLEKYQLNSEKKEKEAASSK